MPSARTRAAGLLAVAGQRRLQDRPAHREGGRLRRQRGRKVAGCRVREGLRADQAQQPGHRLPARRLPPAAAAGARAGGGQDVLAGVRDPRGDVSELRLAVQHRRHHERQDARQGMPPAAPLPRVGDGREAVRHAPAGRLAQLRGPLQQDPARLFGFRAQPLFPCLPSFPLAGRLPAEVFLPAPPRLPIPGPAPLPCLLPRCGQADGLLRLRDHRPGGVSGHGHARLVAQRGLLEGERCQISPVLAGTPLPRPHRDRTATKPVTAGNRSPSRPASRRLAMQARTVTRTGNRIPSRPRMSTGRPRKPTAHGLRQTPAEQLKRLCP